MQKTLVQSMGGENPLEEEMATHSSIPAWETPWTEEPGRLQSMGSQRGGQDLVTEKQQPIMKDLEIVWDTGMKDVHTIQKCDLGHGSVLSISLLLIHSVF